MSLGFLFLKLNIFTLAHNAVISESTTEICTRISHLAVFMHTITYRSQVGSPVGHYRISLFSSPLHQAERHRASPRICTLAINLSVCFILTILENIIHS
jgi:hypothetical protein